MSYRFFVFLVVLGIGLYQFLTSVTDHSSNAIFGACFLVSAFVVPMILLQHFKGLYRLRFKELRPDKALIHLKLWKLFLTSANYTMLKGNTLAELGREKELFSLLDRPELDPCSRKSVEAYYWAIQEDWLMAESALRSAVDSSTEMLQAACRLQLAAHLAEHKQDKLQEAFELWDQATKHPIVAGTEPALLAIEAGLWLAAKQPTIAKKILLANLEPLEKKAKESYDFLPHIAGQYFRMAKCCWALGELEEAKKWTLKSKDTYKSPNLLRRADEMLEAIEKGESFNEYGTPEALEQLAVRAQSFQLLQEWPAGTLGNDG